jgi:hypothetical protein
LIPDFRLVKTTFTEVSSVVSSLALAGAGCKGSSLIKVNPLWREDLFLVNPERGDIV